MCGLEGGMCGKGCGVRSGVCVGGLWYEVLVCW